MSTVKDQSVPDAEKQQEDDGLEKVKPKPRLVNASLVLLYAVLSGMFIIGWVSLTSCPLNKMIPVYLIVAATTGIITRVLINTKNKYLFNLLIVFALFDLFWLILGSYVVYKEYQPNYDREKGPYCNRVAYLLAFWMITIFNSLLGLFVLLSGCYFLMRNSFRKT